MTQTSRPTAQHTDNYPHGDSGPYSSLQWRTLFKELFTTGANQGPLAMYLNELAVSEPVANTVRVATGGAVVGGNIFFSDANVDFTPPAPVGAARYDYVVACLNDTDTAMTVSDAGYTLAFPTVLTDYNGASSVPAYSSRLVIVRGTEGGGLPTLDQNDDHYMVPLATYLISLGGAVSSVTDRRDRALFRSRPDRILVPASRGYNRTDETAIDYSYPSHSEYMRLVMPDQKISWATGFWSPPRNSGPVAEVRAVVMSNATAYVYSRLEARLVIPGVPNTYDGIQVSDGYRQQGVASNAYNEIHEMPLVGLTEERSIVKLRYLRDATNGDDTIDGWVGFIGFLIDYDVVE